MPAFTGFGNIDPFSAFKQGQEEFRATRRAETLQALQGNPFAAIAAKKASGALSESLSAFTSPEFQKQVKMRKANDETEKRAKERGLDTVKNRTQVLEIGEEVLREMGMNETAEAFRAQRASEAAAGLQSQRAGELLDIKRAEAGAKVAGVEIKGATLKEKQAQNRFNNKMKAIQIKLDKAKLAIQSGEADAANQLRRAKRDKAILQIEELSRKLKSRLIPKDRVASLIALPDEEFALEYDIGLEDVPAVRARLKAAIKKPAKPTKITDSQIKSEVLGALTDINREERELRYNVGGIGITDAVQDEESRKSWMSNHWGEVKRMVDEGKAATINDAVRKVLSTTLEPVNQGQQSTPSGITYTVE